MRLRVRGINRCGRTHTLLSMDDSFITKVEIDTQCLDDEMRKDWFRTIIIEREVPIPKKEELDYSNKKTYKRVTDMDHARIIELYYYGTHGQGMGIAKVGKNPKVKRSPSTVRFQLQSHDLEVKTKGSCIKCKISGGKYFDIEVYKKCAHNEGKA